MKERGRVKGWRKVDTKGEEREMKKMKKIRIKKKRYRRKEN